jgi:phosphoglycolate phosphatase-like HAD superfamily hydrolase
MKLVLFDIDGTLLTAGRAPRRAISRALEEVYNISDYLDGISRSSFAGKTDPEIIRSILTKNQYPPSDFESKLPTFFECYTEALREEMQGERKARLHPGVKELLQDLKSSGEACLGLLTGNIYDCAMIKLSHFGIDSFFITGSFGSDSSDRGKLPDIAVKRVFEETGEMYQSKDVVIVGDTFDDLTASRKYGAKTILVATGFYPYEDLAEAGPDYVFQDFSNPFEVVEAIFS